jgi:ABC-2 type transport system ATP-binding protein
MEIQVKNLSKTYEYYKKEQGMRGTLRALFHRETLFAHAVKDVSFSIDSGELVGFLGPNGAGKTTTLKMLSGIIHPSGGEVRVLGFDPADREKAYQKQFALVMGQKNQLIQDLPARETFFINKALYEVSETTFQENLNELIEIFDVGGIVDVPVRKLSLGQKMKCELIVALLHKPKILLLDEPTIGLDVVAQKNIRDFLKKYNTEKKTTIMLTSHYMEDITELCKRVIIINLGSVVYDGSLDNLIKKYAPHTLLKVVFNGEGVKREDFARFGEVVAFSPYTCTVKVAREDARRKTAELLSSTLPVEDVVLDEVGVDEVVRMIFKE